MREIIGFFTFIALTLITFSLIWFGLRSYGLSKPVSQYQTPLIQILKKQAQQQALIWSQDSPQTPLIELTFQNQQWVNKHQKSQTIDDTLATLNFEKQQILLFFDSPNPKALRQLRELFKKEKRWQNTIFCSRFDGLLKDLRDLEPQWSFCSGEIYLTRLLSLSSLRLESLLNMTADVIFLHQNAVQLTTDELQRLVQEAKRQNKLVIIKPVTQKQIDHHWSKLKPHGWMVQVSH